MESRAKFKNTRIYEFPNDFEAVYYRPGWGGGCQPDKLNMSPKGQSPNYEKHRQKTLQKARSKIRRLIKTYILDRFVTLTFKENLQDIKKADAEFRKFMKRLLRRFPECKYVAVREFQERGAVHYHLAANTYIEQKQLHEIWGNGFVWIERKINNSNQLTNYLCKYITKHADDPRLKGFHSYLCSQGLKLNYDDLYFGSGKEMLEFLQKEYGSMLWDKRMLAFEDDNVVWIG